ncbi:MAG: nitrilase-related carbon-nitrogen hydrolase [Planctomycetota bacterium]|jgi:predicted amidohydrolase
MNPHNAHLFQMDIAWEDRAANYRTVLEMLETSDITPGDLIVLPEMFDTGFSLRLEATADHDNATAEFLAQLALDSQCYVHGSCSLVNDNERGQNMALVFDPEGNCVAIYQKLHPFSYDKEAELFDGGDEVVTYAWGASEEEHIVVQPTICYDLRFPELYRLGLVLGAECFVNCANWPETRHHHWKQLSITRAIENQGYFLACNRAGRDPHLNYKGGSLIVDPMGEVVAEADHTPQVLSAPIDIGRVNAWREEFPAWRDRKIPMPGEGGDDDEE